MFPKWNNVQPGRIRTVTSVQSHPNLFEFAFQPNMRLFFFFLILVLLFSIFTVSYFLPSVPYKFDKDAPEHQSANYSPRVKSAHCQFCAGCEWREVITFKKNNNWKKSNEECFLTLENDLESNFSVHKQSFIGTLPCSCIYMLSTNACILQRQDWQHQRLDGSQSIRKTWQPRWCSTEVQEE